MDAALPAARARALAEAVTVFLAGFVLDDLHALRVPGFLVGMGAAVLLLAFGGLVHARSLAFRLEGVPAADAARALRRSKSAWRLAGVGAFALLATWLYLTAGGRDLWPA